MKSTTSARNKVRGVGAAKRVGSLTVPVLYSGKEVDKDLLTRIEVQNLRDSEAQKYDSDGYAIPRTVHVHRMKVYDACTKDDRDYLKEHIRTAHARRLMGH